MVQSAAVLRPSTSPSLAVSGPASVLAEHDAEQRRNDTGFLVSLVFHIAVLLTLALIVTEPPTPSPVIAILASTGPEDGPPELEADLLVDLPTTASPAADAPAIPDVDLEIVPAPFVAVTASETFGPPIELTADGDLPGLPPAAGLVMKVGGGRDGDVTASMYGLEATGSRFAFVVDRSSSMGGAPLERLKQELRYAIANLPREAEFLIVYFSTDALPMPTRAPVPATAVHKEKFLTWSEGITADGGTDPSQAMREALSHHPSTVFLITDGQFDPGPTLAGIAELNAARRAQIHTVAIGVGAVGAEPVLRRIAAENGGEYRFVVDEVTAGQFAPRARGR